jgi:RNA polymerase sigma-70 factor (ECF subfamily)
VSLSDADTGWEDRLATSDPSIETVLEQRQMQAGIEASLTELPRAERAALVLFHQEGRRYDEIAAILDVPVNTVRTHLHRGRNRLAAILRARMARHDM